MRSTDRGRRAAMPLGNREESRREEKTSADFLTHTHWAIYRGALGGYEPYGRRLATHIAKELPAARRPAGASSAACRGWPELGVDRRNYNVISQKCNSS